MNDTKPKTTIHYIAEIDNLRGQLEVAHKRNNELLDDCVKTLDECVNQRATIERLRKIYLAAEHLMSVWQREHERVAGLDELRRAVEEYRKTQEVKPNDAR